MRVTALAGGTGAAKLVRGLSAVLDPDDLTVIVNTGDDTEVWGLAISPDLDTITYALAGLLDVSRGWGRRDETFHCREAMAALGIESWFSLGDRDLATHLYRTRRFHEGASLSEVTRELCGRLGAAARLLPATDDPVRTRLRSPGGWLSFQEYFVRDRAKVEVLEIAYDGAAAARPAPGVLNALDDADLVVVCPSNPVTSIGPILAVPGVRDALVARSRPAVAVSPIVGGAAVSGPAAQLMRAQGLEVSPLGIAAAYAHWLGTLAIDARDAGLEGALDSLGVSAVVAEIVMSDRDREMALARRLLECAA